MLTALIFVTLFYGTRCTYVISVYGDVYKDTKFFTETYPWIIDNVGGDITVDYYLLGSGRYSVPQMCALNALRSNTFLQALYLKCEAEGTQSDVCLCETGIDPQKFKQCVHSRGSLASVASEKYTQLSIDASPVVEVGPRNTVFEVADSWYLKKICTIFGDHLPRGCVKPFACNGTQTLSDRRGLAHFDCSSVQRDCEVSASKTTEIPYTTGIEYTTEAF